MEMPSTTITTTSHGSQRGDGFLICPIHVLPLAATLVRARPGDGGPSLKLIRVRFFEGVPSTRRAIRYEVATAIRIDAR